MGRREPLEVLTAERAPVGAEGLESVERRLLVERQFQEIGEPRRSLQRRADLYQRVVAPRKMRAHARPRPRFRRRGQPGANRIERESAQRVEEIGRRPARTEANRPLKQMAGRAGDERGEAPMRLPHRPSPPGKGRPRHWGQDEMNGGWA